MSEASPDGLTRTLIRIGPFLTASCAAVVLLHAAIYIVLKNGVLGQTDAFVMLAPVILYLFATTAVLVLLVVLCLKKEPSAVWYFVSLLICLGGLVMALVEFDHYLEVA